MSVQALNIIKSWFETGDKPTAAQFADTLDSFRHKSQKITTDDIEGFSDFVTNILSASAFDSHLSDELAHHDAIVSQIENLVNGGTGLSLNYSVDGDLVGVSVSSQIGSTPTTLSEYGITDAQAMLVSGTNIKTVNSNSLLGSGNIVVGDALLNGTQTFTGLNTFTQPLQALSVTINEPGVGYRVALSRPSLGVLQVGEAGFGSITVGQSTTGSRLLVQSAGVNLLSGSATIIVSTGSSIRLTRSASIFAENTTVTSNTAINAQGAYNYNKKTAGAYSFLQIGENFTFGETTSTAISATLSLLEFNHSINYPTTIEGIVRTIYNNVAASIGAGVEHRFIDSEHGNVYFKTCKNFQVFTDATVSAFRVDNATYTAGTSETRLVLLDLKTNTQKRVLFGADDSAGTGYKTLRILN